MMRYDIIMTAKDINYGINRLAQNTTDNISMSIENFLILVI